MALVEFDLKSLDSLDGGRVLVAWQQALKRVMLDCQDRPAVSDARKITLQTDVVPVIGDDGLLDTVRLQFQVKDTAPVRKSKKYEMEPRRGGMLVFNDLSDDNVKQRTLDELETETDD